MILCIFGGEIVSDCLQIPEDFSIHIAFMTSLCAMHQHDYLELAYIRRGWTQHTLEGETRTLTAGDFILVDYGEVHSYDVVGQNLEAINCMFRPVSIDSGLRNCRSFPKGGGHGLPAISETGADAVGLWPAANHPELHSPDCRAVRI